MNKKYFIKNLKDNSVDYTNWCATEEYAYKSIENRFRRAGLLVDVVKLVDGVVEVYYEGKQLIKLQVFSQDLGEFYIADVSRGSLVKAYFNSAKEAEDFLMRTYDKVSYDEEDDVYIVIHANTFVGGFVVM
ncbi:MAG: hypothetical protein ACRCX2_28250 [Paraclostridium sp.]